MAKSIAKSKAKIQAVGSDKQLARGEPSAVHLVLGEIKRRLRTGELTPGQPLIASELAQDLNLSRVPVREAIHVLAGEGVIDLRLNQSARIRPIAVRDLVDMLRLLSALGKLSLELAAAHMSDSKQRASVRATVEEINNALSNRNSASFFTAADAFHNAINVAADNHYLKITYGHLHMDYFNRALASRLPGDHWPKFEANYRAIGEALLSGNAKLACKRYQEHMEWAVAQLKEDLAQEERRAQNLRRLRSN